MKNFSFRLESVLGLREAERDAKRAAYSLALSATGRARSDREQIECELLELQSLVRHSQATGAVNLESFLRIDRYGMSLRLELARRIVRERLAEQEEQRCQHAFTQAEREVQSLEKLREQQLTRHQQESSRAETKLLDEIVSARFARGPNSDAA